MLDKMKIFIVTLALVCVAAGQNSSESTSVVASSTEGPTTRLVPTASQTTGSIKDKTTVEDKTTKPDTTTANLDTTIVTTPAPITTAPIPPGWETTNNYTYAPKKNGTVCLMAVFSAHFKQEDNTWNVSKDAAIVHDDSGCGRLSVNFGKNNFVLSFNQTSKGAFYLSEVNATISKTDKEIRPSAGGLTMAKTSNGSSYMCLSGLTIDLSENVTFYMKQVQFQVYYVKDAKFATGSWPDIKSVSWQVEDKDKATVFKADMAIQWHVKYNKNVSAKVEVTDMYFEFTDKGQLSLVDHNDNYTEVQFIDKEKDQNLTLVFELDGDMYTLTKAELSFQILKDVFPDATNIGDFVVSTAKLALLQTGTKKSYACSTQTQFRLMSNETTKQDEMDIYVRFVPPSGKSLMLQAITFSKKDTYDPSSPCFTDKLPPAKMMGYKLLDSKKQICAMLDSVIDLKNVHYTAIDGTDMVTQVPIAMPVIPPSGSCQKNLTIIVIDLGKSNGISTGNLTLKYIIKVMKSEYYGDVQESVLDNITLAYNPMSPFFPNHGSMNKRETITADGLDGFQTPVANSYECDSMTEVNVTKDMTVTFNNTKMQAFNVDGGNYSDAFNCHTVPTTTAAETTAAETTAAKTTAAPTTPEPIFPDPILPMSSDRVVKDGNETCLHADIGLQIRLLYQQKSMSSGNLTEIFFNFDAANCTTSAKCVNSSTAVVTFERNGDYEQTLILTFTKDAKSMMTYLSDVSLQYTLNKHFPDAKGKGVQKYSQSGMYLSAPSTKSFGCNSTWTDVMMHSSDSSTVDTMGTVVRIVPIIVEAFPKSNKFAPEHKCYSDMPVPKPETGRWYINSTDNNSSVCASFEFASSVNITYKLLVDGNHKTVTIPLDSVKHNVTESFGMCMQNKTTLMITMDNNKMNFTFEFKKKNISNDGKTFEYSMTGVAVIYSTDTKYLPNHEYVEGNIVPLSSMTLNLFSTDNDHSYKCTTNVSTALSGGAAISFSNVQVQPFNVKSNGQFSSADDCSADNNLSKAARIGILCAIVVAGIALLTCVCCFAYPDSCAADDMSPLIPIIVGSILAGLVVIVLVAYVIGRRRNSGANYETI